MENSNAEKTNSVDAISKIHDQTPISILIQDLNSTSNLMKSDVEKNLLSRLVKVLNDSYLNREREIMTKFAFDFYADLSRKMNVPENLISENFTHAETYFDIKFNRDEAQDL
jgi:hypothetical protein